MLDNFSLVLFIISIGSAIYGIKVDDPKFLIFGAILYFIEVIRMRIYGKH